MKFHREKELLNLIKRAVDKRPSGKNLAVLDADGTLWPEDANHILLDYQIKKNKKKFQELLGIDYQTHRHKLCEVFVQKQSGLTLEQFKSKGREAFKQNPLHVFPFQRLLLDYLKKQNMKVAIVTASIQWLVELAVEIYHLPVDLVLGMKTERDGKIITDKILYPAPVGRHKAEVLLKYLPEESCFLAGGNTPTDQPLLELADLPFVVHSANSKNVIFPAEKKLKQLALKKNWILFEKKRLITRLNCLKNLIF
ncbi:MAG: haloacid dehalogenase-like hydrolase [Oligoflexia bacterium]|nr:haloacid dehalogenase-like hydrolase [Oligoflexia bacterium]